MRILLLVSLTACLDTEGPVDTQDCSGFSQGVSGQVLEGPTDQPVGTSLRVTGKLTHLDGLAIREVLVAGVRATADDFNFGDWSVEVRYETLRALVDETGNATLDIIALDACGTQHPVTSFSVPVDLDPAVDVHELELAVTLPGGQDYMPPDGVTPAVLTLTADAEAAGAVVELTATHGSFAGTFAGDQVVLTGSDLGSTATVLYYADTAGTVLITATAEGLIDVQTVEVAGPPTLVPPSAELDPGQSVVVTVFTDGEVAECTASFADGLTVESGGTDLSQSGAVSDTNGDGRPDFTVTAGEDYASDLEVRVRCADVFDQASIGAYVAFAPEETDSGF